MLDPILSKDMDSESRKFNNIILKGLKIETDIELIDQILVAVLNKKGDVLTSEFTYNGYEKLTPIDEIKLIKNTKSATAIDISISDVRKYKLIFNYNGEIIEHIILLLAQQYDNSIRISGNKIYLAPVWTDPIISTGPTGYGMFIKFYGGKYNVLTLNHTLIVNSQLRHIGIANIKDFYNLTKNKKDISKRYRDLKVPLSLYPLLKYSLREVVEKYCHLKFGKEFIISFNKIEDIDLEKYDCITTRGEQLKNLAPYPERHTTHIYIAKEANDYAYKLAYGIIYAFDALPKRSVEIIKGIDTTKEKNRWSILIATLAFKDSYNSSGLLEALQNHIAKIESFMDSVTKEQLAELNIIVDDIYDFTVYITANYDRYNRMGRVYSNIFKNKRLELAYYVMFNTIVGINRLIDELYKNAKLNRLNSSQIKKALKDKLSPKGIFNIVKSSEQILPVAQFATVNDNRITKLSMTEIQDRADGVKRPSNSKGGNKKQFPVSVRLLNGYALIMGNALHYPKNCPTPLRTMNPFTRFKSNGGIDLDPELEKEIIYIDKLLRNEFKEGELVDNKIKLFNDFEKID